MPAILNPAGATWWKKNQGRYPNSRDLAALEGTFRDHVTAFIAALRSGGAAIQIGSTRRSPERAYLMHFAWAVANNQIEPGRVPARPGVNIDWDLGDDKASRRAAQEMVDLAHMAHIASLTSNHTRGTAIDMTITWKGDLTLKIPYSRVPLWQIKTSPRTGAGNVELHAVGELFSVRKLSSDPPHWSVNGH